MGASQSRPAALDCTVINSPPKDGALGPGLVSPSTPPSLRLRKSSLRASQPTRRVWLPPGASHCQACRIGGPSGKRPWITMFSGTGETRLQKPVSETSEEVLVFLSPAPVTPFLRPLCLATPPWAPPFALFREPKLKFRGAHSIHRLCPVPVCVRFLRRHQFRLFFFSWAIFALGLLLSREALSSE